MALTPFWIAGSAEYGEDTVDVRHPFDGEVVGSFTWATPDHVERAIDAAETVAAGFANLPARVRADACSQISWELHSRRDEAAELITAESGKPIMWARAEVARAISTFSWAATEARQFSGDLQRLDTAAGSDGKLAMVRRFPIGPVLGITPFNFPLNLVAHKVAPALAVGAPIIVKPAPATPLSSFFLAEIVSGVDLPDGVLSVVPVRNEDASTLVDDVRLPVVSFTGSEPVGWSIKESIPRKHVTLELGGDAAAVVAKDYVDDVSHAVSRIATFANYQAGQSCIAVQRVFVHGSLYVDFVDALVEEVRRLGTGDPREDTCQVGPLISVDAAKRVQEFIAEAQEAGADLRCGGIRDGASVTPAVLTDVPDGVRLASEEVFGPVLTVSPFESLDEAFAAVNDSRFGLQAGVFTKRWDVAARAHRELDVGGVVIGDVPSVRADQMPYGGNKASGVGREGLLSAMNDYTRPRVLLLPDSL